MKKKKHKHKATVETTFRQRFTLSTEMMIFVLVIKIQLMHNKLAEMILMWIRVLLIHFTLIFSRLFHTEVDILWIYGIQVDFSSSIRHDIRKGVVKNEILIITRRLHYSSLWFDNPELFLINKVCKIRGFMYWEKVLILKNNMQYIEQRPGIGYWRSIWWGNYSRGSPIWFWGGLAPKFELVSFSILWKWRNWKNQGKIREKE